MQIHTRTRARTLTAFRSVTYDLATSSQYRIVQIDGFPVGALRRRVIFQIEAMNPPRKLVMVGVLPFQQIRDGETLVTVRRE